VRGWVSEWDSKVNEVDSMGLQLNSSNRTSFGYTYSSIIYK
jgi:hypothetical protein